MNTRLHIPIRSWFLSFLVFLVFAALLLASWFWQLSKDMDELAEARATQVAQSSGLSPACRTYASRLIKTEMKKTLANQVLPSVVVDKLYFPDIKAAQHDYMMWSCPLRAIPSINAAGQAVSWPFANVSVSSFSY
ncbi:hypothetical protein ACQU0X_27080 [Pseudovibrio ascidiaceicola]|uniref:hypothetical protein n=1 Tax=Pseudovibrio ascidiaceicola TaxID=285279 RepID=UPI003D35DC20